MIEEFQKFKLHPALVQAVTELGYESPTPIQAHAIPLLLSGHDIMGQAQTGSGKTAAFALPMLHTLQADQSGVQALIVAPTRELAIQVAEAVHNYGQYQNVRVLAVYGGQSYTPQIRSLKRGVDVVVGTPGRMLDLIRKGLLDLSAVRYLVLDEADEMLSMGFIEDIEAILSETPPLRQTALFSATLPRPIRRLADSYLHDPEAITINPQQMTVAQTEQRYYMVNERDKLAALGRLIEHEEVTCGLIFARTKVGTDKLAEQLLARGFQAEALHGDMSQAAREAAMGRFRRGLVRFLVATDVAARGLDIDDISHVINYDMPYDVESYVHRIGRTGRAGKEGVALTLVTPRERGRLRKIEAYTRQSLTRATLPTAAEIAAQRDAHFLLTVSAQLEADTLDAERAVAAQLLDAGYHPLDVAAAVIKLARATEEQRPIEPISEVRERKSARKSERRGKKGRRHAQNHEPGMVRMTVDAGKAHGVRPRDIVGAIASEAGIPGKAIGAIDIQGQQTFVDVKEKYAGRVLKRMKHSQIRGRDARLRAAG